jgi:CRISPR/Cas system-associated protein Cas10 (large subunit of type III CRISPR-Cas system)
MPNNATARKIEFEGVQLTLREIAERFFPLVSIRVLRHRLASSGAKTVAEMRAYLEKPLPKANTAGMNKHIENTVKAAKAKTESVRFSREVREKSDTITGKKGCNYCHRDRPIGDLKEVNRSGRKRLICNFCSESRDQALQSRT